MRWGAIKSRAVLGALVFATFATGEAKAWECIDDGCPVWCGLPVSYQIGELPAGVDEVAFVAEIQRAFGDWEAVGCSELAFSYEGRVPVGGATAPLTVEFLETWTMGAGAINVSTPRWIPEGCIMDAAMLFNAENYEFVVGGGGGPAVDLYTSAAGALGRAFGLGNSSDPTSVMRATETGVPAEITADDVDGVCTLYGSGTGLELCDQCFRDDICGDDGDLCVEYPDGNGYCGTACTDGGGECAADESCVAVGDAMQCVRIIDGEQQCVAAGTGDTCSPCTGNEECAGECVMLPDGNSYCFNLCDGPDGCVAGEECVGASGGVRLCVLLVDGAPSCDGPVPDAGPLDAGTPDTGAFVDGGVDAGGVDGDGDGCGCTITSPVRSLPTGLLFLGVFALMRRRSR